MKEKETTDHFLQMFEKLLMNTEDIRFRLSDIFA